MVNAADKKVNPLDPLTKKIKEYTRKRSKTDADLEMIARLEWEAGLYYDSNLGPVIPAKCIEATIRASARMQKRGKDVERGVMMIEDNAAIEYDGPRTPDKMWADGRFTDMRVVRVQSSRVMRCRPIFPVWALAFALACDEECVNKNDVVHFLENAGAYVGLCEMRPRFGRFSVHEVEKAA